jgi:FkbH-like protein
MSHISGGRAAGVAAKLAGLAPAERLDAAATLLGGAAFDRALVDAVFDALVAAGTAEERATLDRWVAALDATPSAHYFRARWSAGADPGTSATHWAALLASGTVTDPFLHLQGARAQAGVGRHGGAARLLRSALDLRPEYGFYARSEKLLLDVWRHAPPSQRRCRIAVLGSSTTALLVPVLRALCFRDGIAAEFYEGTYGAFRQEVLDPSSGLHRFRPDVAFVVTHWRDVGLPAVADDPEGVVAAAVTELGRLWQILGQQLGCHVVQHAFDEPAAEAFGYLSQAMPGGRVRVLRAINARLTAEAPAHVSVLDTPAVMAAVGSSRWDDPYLWHTAQQHPGLEALPALAEAQVAHVRAVLGLTRKVLVCDLDNTLWGGVIGEDGLDGIRLGPGSPEGEAYAALHRYVLDLKSRGILVAVCSKNNPEDARLPFESHAHMGLRLGDIAAFVANWEDKATNLRAIADRLSLGLDSLVFLDDNPLERAWVRSQLPEVAVVELGPSPHTYVRDLDRGRHFFGLTLSAEDRGRAAAYQAQAEAATLREAAPSLTAFLEQLQMRAAAVPVSAKNLARVTQLTNKTNQFNLTTRRYTEAQVSQLAADPHNWTAAFSLADRFGDHGLIGVLFCRATEPATWEIDTWLMSCRVLGRQMEEFMFDAMVDAAIAAGIRRIVGVYRPTAKNVIVTDLYPRLGFQRLAEGETETRYEYVIPAEPRRRCAFIAHVVAA